MSVYDPVTGEWVYTQEDADRAAEYARTHPWPMCEGCGVRSPDVRGTAWSDHDWCDECNGGRRR